MWLKVACLLAPISLAIDLGAPSKIFAVEVVLPALALFVFLTRKSFPISQDFRVIMCIGAAYLFAQMLSDVINNTSEEQYIRGWARITLFLINFISIYIIIGNSRSCLLFFAIGVAIGRFWAASEGFDAETLPWKIGLAKPIALIVLVCCILLAAPPKTKTPLIAAVVFALGLFDITMDFRSHGLVLIGTAVLLLLPSCLPLNSNPHRPTLSRAYVAVSLGGLVASLIAYQFYDYAAQSGWLSERAVQKFETQVERADTSVLIAGRSEILVYFEAIYDGLFLGHGSWPRNAHYADKLASERYELGLSGSRSSSSDDSIPIHSHIFGSWIEAGLIGGAFWLVVVALIVRSLLRSSVGSSHLRPLYVYGALLLLWDIFFSPFSGFRRFETAFLMVIVLRSLLQRQVKLNLPKLRSSASMKNRRGKKRRRSKRPEQPQGRTAGA